MQPGVSSHDVSSDKILLIFYYYILLTKQDNINFNMDMVWHVWFRIEKQQKLINNWISWSLYNNQ